MAAEDIVSESLINLWETSKKEKVEYPLALLVQMLKNGSLNYLKHQDVKQAVSESISSKMDRACIIVFRLYRLVTWKKYSRLK